jgi:hypothetical protein
VGKLDEGGVDGVVVGEVVGTILVGKVDGWDVGVDHVGVVVGAVVGDASVGTFEG